jgi:hypothetical protein
MTEPLVAESAEAGHRGTTTRRRVLVIGLVIALVVVAAAFWLGARWGGRTQTATAYCSALGPALLCGDEPGSGDYGGAASVAWTQDGAFRMDGLPDCLDRRDSLIQVVIGYEEVEADGVRVNRVVWVDCDSAVPAH